MMNTVGLSQPNNVTLRAAANQTNVNELEAKAKAKEQAKEQASQAKPMVANAAPAGVGAKLNVQG